MRIKIRFDKSGDSFKVENACSPDAKDCQNTFSDVLNKVGSVDANTFEHTEEFFREDELPPQMETVGH
jgi:hypothetical protein